MLNQAVKEKERKALNSPLQGPMEVTRVAKPDQENETSTEGGEMSALRCCWG